MNKIGKSLAIFAGIVLLAGTAIAQMLPDLTVKDVVLDEMSKITFELSNESSEAVDSFSNGFIYVYVDGKVAWTYNWKYLKETGFLSANGSSVITSQIPKSGKDIKVCIDARENVTEGDEGNNCFAVEVEMDSAPVASALPDLAVTDIFVDPFTGRLTVEHGNIGNGKVSDYNGNVNIYVNGKSKWTYNWAAMNKQFLNPGTTSQLTPNKFRGTHEVTACTSTKSIIDEVSKTNNCLTKFVTGHKVILTPPNQGTKNNFVYKTRKAPETYSRNSLIKPDFTVTNLYRGEDNVIYAEITNSGTAHSSGIVGEITFFLDGRRQSEKLWTSFANYRGFLSANGSIVIPVYKVIGGHEVKVCVDSVNRVQESNENNNCLNTLIR